MDRRVYGRIDQFETRLRRLAAFPRMGEAEEFADGFGLSFRATLIAAIYG